MVWRLIVLKIYGWKLDLYIGKCAVSFTTWSIYWPSVLLLTEDLLMHHFGNAIGFSQWLLKSRIVIPWSDPLSQPDVIQNILTMIKISSDSIGFTVWVTVLFKSCSFSFQSLTIQKFMSVVLELQSEMKSLEQIKKSGVTGQQSNELCKVQNSQMLKLSYEVQIYIKNKCFQ